jgi:glutaredoxin
LERLQQIFAEKPATVVSTTYCPYCTKAKKLLEQNKVEYKEIMLDEIYGQD